MACLQKWGPLANLHLLLEVYLDHCIWNNGAVKPFYWIKQPLFEELKSCDIGTIHNNWFVSFCLIRKVRQQKPISLQVACVADGILIAVRPRKTSSEAAIALVYQNFASPVTNPASYAGYFTGQDKPNFGYGIQLARLVEKSVEVAHLCSLWLVQGTHWNLENKIPWCLI